MNEEVDSFLKGWIMLNQILMTVSALIFRLILVLQSIDSGLCPAFLKKRDCVWQVIKNPGYCLTLN
ncbi:hypothetical protein [Dyadobacter soli]|uniref:hypothetical protein n=1 Tax=Dyadobacter soli TaxID=659014 RepID=UPI0015A4CC38|nr:hypothetical protein [Dyadobacter soli]